MNPPDHTLILSSSHRNSSCRPAFSKGLLAALFALVAGTSTQAATWTWTGLGVDNNWSTAANWTDGVTTGVPINGDTLIFAGSTQLTTNNDLTAGTSFASVQFASGAGLFVLGGNSFALTGGITSAAAGSPGTLENINNDIDLGTTEHTFSLSVGGTTTEFLALNGVLSGTGAAGVFKSDAGKIYLNNASNTYTGRTILSGGYMYATTLANGGVASSIGAASSSNANWSIGGSNVRFVYTGDTTSTDRLFSIGATGAGFLNNGTGAVNFTNTGAISSGPSTRTFTFGGTYTGTNVLAPQLVNPTNANQTLGVLVTTSGSWEFTNANTFTGAVSITQGTLVASSIGNGGVASNIGAATSAASNLLLNGGGLRYTGSTTTTDRLFTVNNTSATGNKISASGTGTISFTNPGSIAYGASTAGQTRVLVLGGTNTGNNTLTPIIGNNGANAVSLTKEDAGTWVLAGTNTYTGATAVNGGKLAIGSTGSINSSSGVTVAPGATFAYNNTTTPVTRPITLNGAGTGSRALLAGNGTIASSVALDDLGDTLSPGNSPGVLAFNASQSWDSFSYDWEINSFTGTVAGTDFDKINITGSLTLSGSYQLNLISLTAGNMPGFVGGFTEVAQSWTILTATGGITGFNLGNWTLNANGFTSNPAYGGTFTLTQAGNDIVLQYAVPEPSVAGFAAIGLVVLTVASRSRRSRRA